MGKLVRLLGIITVLAISSACSTKAQKNTKEGENPIYKKVHASFERNQERIYK